MHIQCVVVIIVHLMKIHGMCDACDVCDAAMCAMPHPRPLPCVLHPTIAAVFDDVMFDAIWHLMMNGIHHEIVCVPDRTDWQLDSRDEFYKALFHQWPFAMTAINYASEVLSLL